MALELALISVLAGIILGLRYKVFVIVPAVALAMVFGMMAGIVRADPFWSIVLVMVGLGAAVQFGYLAGIAMRAIVGSVILKRPNGPPGNKPSAPSDEKKSESHEPPASRE